MHAHRSEDSIKKFTTRFVNSGEIILSAPDGIVLSLYLQEIEEATITLQKVIIPQFAAKINERSLKIKSCSQLVEEMHRHGINLRYLGLVRSLVTDKKRRVIILMEMILRYAFHPSTSHK